MGSLVSKQSRNNSNNAIENNNENKKSTNTQTPLRLDGTQGKSTPEHKSPAMGHYPLNDIKSLVSKESVSILKTVYI